MTRIVFCNNQDCRQNLFNFTVLRLISYLTAVVPPSARGAFFLICVARKVGTACLRTNKIVPLTDLNKHLYSGKSEIKVNTNNSSEKVY